MSRLSRQIDSKELIQKIDLISLIEKYTTLHKKGNYYIGTCPFHQETSPSFSIKNNHFECYACQIKGNGIFDFIMQKENLNFEQALSFLNKDVYTTNHIKKTTNKKLNTSSVNIEFVDGSFTDKHLEYWEKLNMDEKFLTENNVFAVKEWAMGFNNLKKMHFTKDEITFAYYAEDIKKCKILRIGPQISFQDKWRTSVPNNYLWYYNQFSKENPVDLGFTVKSVKDSLIVKKLNRNAIATNNESDKILLTNNVQNINDIFKKNIMCYGTDPDGKNKSINITKKTGWGWFNIPNHLYDEYQIEDFADFLNSGFSYNQLEQLFKNKNL